MSNRSIPILFAAACLASLPVATLHFLGSEQVAPGGGVHFLGVALSAMLAVVTAAALVVAGVRAADGRAVLVGSAFSLMAALLCLHGLTTPGILVGSNGVVAFTGGATLPVGGAILALSALPALRRPEAVQPLLVLLGTAIALVFGLGAASIAWPDLVPAVPEPRSGPALALLVLGVVVYLVLALRAWRTWLLARRSADLLVLVGLVWLGAALVASLVLTFSDLGWWLGHGFEVVGILFVAAPVALDLKRAAPTRALVGDLTGSDLVAREEAYLGSEVRALMVALAEKDTSTEEHTRRVARLAVCVGEELALTPSRLRALALGGLLHDMGKLSVPDEILTKPGPLTQAEFEVVKEHPESGVRLLRGIGGFGSSVERLVRDHHERLDGTGYPRGRREAQLDLDTRILAVCDVYDALVSERIYRPAIAPDEAMRILRKGAGVTFDGRCIEALARVLATQYGRSLAVAV